MKEQIFFMALLFCAAAAFGQQRKLVVPPLENRGSTLNAAALENLQDSFINEFINSGRFQVPDRNALELLANEQKFQLSDWSDDKKSAEMGKVLNADYIVRVSVRHNGEFNYLSARILDVNTASGLTAGTMEFSTQRDALGKIEGFVSGILQRIGGVSARNAVPAGFVLVEGGTFQMGSNNGESNEKPVHSVTVKSFYMGKYEVTQKEWQELMGYNPSNFKGNKLPVETVNWYEAVEYCNRRSLKEGLTPAYQGSGDSISCDWNAKGYRLPTEAEWEYAAKGGEGSQGNYTYSGSNSADSVAWHEGNSEGRTHDLGMMMPNVLGIYDMTGNVSEWCWDWLGSYGTGGQTNPRGASFGVYRIGRGGGWGNSASYVRSAYRYFASPTTRGSDVGFRLVRSLF